MNEKIAEVLHSETELPVMTEEETLEDIMTHAGNDWGQTQIVRQ